MSRSATVLDAPDSADGVLASGRILFEYLTTALALSRDPSLVRTIRERAGRPGERLFLAFGERGPFIHLTRDTVGGCSVELPRGSSAGAPVDLRALLARDRAVLDALRVAHDRTGVLPEVAGWLRSFASGADAMTRETFRAIAAWQPLVAVEAYRQLAHASMALDAERRQLVSAAARNAAPARSLEAYWAVIHMMSNAMLLATMGAERAWLGDLEASLPRGRWTPSFPLVRERCARLALRAGWAAAAFGDRAVGRYLDVLASGASPLRAFDATLGLTAIGARDEALAAPIDRALRAALASAEAMAPPGQRFLYEAMSRSAHFVLTEPARAARVTRERTARLEHTSLAGDEDPAEVEDGVFPTVVGLAVAVGAPADELFSSENDRASPGPTRRPLQERAREVLLRTSAPSSDAASSPRWIH